MYKQTYNKYNNKKTVRNGVSFDSIKEADRYCELVWLEKSGEICELERQVKYVLIPSQYEARIVNSKAKKVCVEKECSYYADFVYKDKNGNTIIEDVKGYKKGTAYNLFSIKRKLMLYVHNIKIKEV